MSPLAVVCPRKRYKDTFVGTLFESNNPGGFLSLAWLARSDSTKLFLDHYWSPQEECNREFDADARKFKIFGIETNNGENYHRLLLFWGRFGMDMCRGEL